MQALQQPDSTQDTHPNTSQGSFAPLRRTFPMETSETVRGEGHRERLEGGRVTPLHQGLAIEANAFRSWAGTTPSCEALVCESRPFRCQQRLALPGLGRLCSGRVYEGGATPGIATLTLNHTALQVESRRCQGWERLACRPQHGIGSAMRRRAP